MPRVEQDDRPARYIEPMDDGRTKVVYRASGLTLCPSAFAALALGHQPAPPPPRLQEAFDRGHEAEPMIMAELEATPKLDGRENQYSIALSDTQPVFELVMYEDDEKVVVVRGRVDNMGFVSRIGSKDQALTEARAVIEAKNFRMGYWSTFLKHGIAGFENYMWQTSFYGLAAAREKDDGWCPVLFACRSDDTGKVLVQWLDTPPKTMKQLRAHVLGIEDLCQDAIDEGEIPKCANPSWPCPMWKLHDVAIEMPEATIDLIIEEDDDEYADYKQALDDWIDAKTDEEKLTKKAKTAAEWRKTCGEVLRAMLEDRNIDPSKEGGVKVRVGACVITWSETEVDAHMVKASKRTTFNVKVEP